MGVQCRVLQGGHDKKVKKDAKKGATAPFLIS
jgi:hypothetical protein